MINTIKANEFINGIMSIRPNSFTADALSQMFDWFEQYEHDTGEQVEFDPIAICCDFSQSTLEEVNSYYSKEFTSLGSCIEWLNDNTMVIATSGDWVVYQQF
jgi:hypothetical protein